MSLILRNEEFLERSLEDTEAFGWSFTLTNPLGESQAITGQARHINMLIDMDTGADVQQEQASDRRYFQRFSMDRISCHNRDNQPCQ